MLNPIQSEFPDVKNYKWRLNPVWHRMLYSCTYMATVSVKGLSINVPSVLVHFYFLVNMFINVSWHDSIFNRVLTMCVLILQCISAFLCELCWLSRHTVLCSRLVSCLCCCVPLVVCLLLLLQICSEVPLTLWNSHCIYFNVHNLETPDPIRQHFCSLI